MFCITEADKKTQVITTYNNPHTVAGVGAEYGPRLGAHGKQDAAARGMLETPSTITTTPSDIKTHDVRIHFNSDKFTSEEKRTRLMKERTEITSKLLQAHANVRLKKNEISENKRTNQHNTEDDEELSLLEDAYSSLQELNNDLKKRIDALIPRVANETLVTPNK
jgi:hypothetical protein